MKMRISVPNWIFYTAIFAFFIVFFTRIHPIAPYDGDDWFNIIIERTSYPSLEFWNPTKVFPERLEPFVATLAGYLVVPLVGDYITGLIWANAFVVAIFIIVYLLSVQRCIETRFNLSRLIVQGLIIVFILLHFLLLRTSGECNEHHWYSNDANCYYHYIIPNMLCASLVLWLMRHDVRKENNGRTIAILILLTYLALCSNLYSVVILIAYIGALLLLDLRTTSHSVNQSTRTKDGWLLAYIRRDDHFLVIIALWGVVQWIESHGIRANSYGYMKEPLIYCLKVTIYNFLTISYNKWFLFVALLAIVGAKLIDYRRKSHGLWYVGIRQWSILIATFLSIIYLILLSSRVDPTYVQRGDVIFEFAFFLLFLVILSLAYLCSHLRFTAYFTPLLILFLLFQTNTSGRTYKDVSEKYAPDLAGSIRIDRDIVRQILDAEAAGMDSVTIQVPKYPYGENWPIMTPRYASQYYGRALYKHNQTKREIITIFIPSYEIEE